MTNKVQNLIIRLKDLANEGNFSRITNIVNEEFNIYKKGFQGEVPATLWGLAANVGGADLVEALLEIGADPNQEMQGYRAQFGPLHQVIYGAAIPGSMHSIQYKVDDMPDRLKIMDMLVDAGVKIDAQGTHGYEWRPVVLASQFEKNNHALSAKLIELGANPFATSSLPALSESDPLYEDGVIATAGCLFAKQKVEQGDSFKLPETIHPKVVDVLAGGIFKIKVDGEFTPVELPEAKDPTTSIECSYSESDASILPMTLGDLGLDF